jgi:hypothetical protein
MVRPELFTHEEIFAAEQKSKLPLRLAYIGLWTQCDREGRFEWRPLRLKLAILPWDEADFEAVLSALAEAGFVVRYQIDVRDYGYIPAWHKHQKPHKREAQSVIPPPSGEVEFSPRPAQGAPKAGLGLAISAGDGDGDGDGDGKWARTPAKQFIKPTMEEVAAYCKERGGVVDPQRWFDHYESNGWKVGRNPMKDWQAAVRKWENNGHANGAVNGQQRNGPRPLSDEEIEKLNRTGSI